jgi:hypothetical protein
VRLAISQATGVLLLLLLAVQQVGDLPVKRVPLRLAVVGSPLVLSKERVLLQGLQALLAAQHAQRAAAAASSTPTAAAEEDSSGMSRAKSPGATTAAAAVGDHASAGSSSSSAVEVAGVTAVQLALGVLPVGVLHERSFYVVNTGRQTAPYWLVEFALCVCSTSGRLCSRERKHWRDTECQCSYNACSAQGLCSRLLL